MLNSAKKLVSTKKADVEAMLRQFNIAVDSPGTVMTQDKSKEYLQQATPKTLYQLFMESTRLDKVIHNLREAQAVRDQTNQRLLDRQQALKQNERKLKQKEAQLRDAISIRALQERHSALANELAWAGVREAEEEAKLAAQRAAEAAVELTTLKEKAKTFDVRTEELTAKREALQAELGSTVEVTERLYNEVRELEDKVQRMDQSCAKLKGSINQYEHALKTAEKQIKTIEAEVESEKQRALVDREAEAKAREERLADKVAARQEVQKRQREHEDKMKNTESSCQFLRDQLNRANSKQQDITHKLEVLKKREQSLLAYKDKKLRVFGDHTEAFIAELKRHASSFKHLPIGPLGVLIKLNDESWATAVESSIWSVMQVFLVSCFEDLAVYKKVAQTFRRPRFVEPDVVVSTFSSRKHNVEPLRGFTSVCSLIELDLQTAKTLYPEVDPVLIEATVFNTIVDHANADRTIVMADVADAKRIVFGGRAPDGSTCYLNDGTVLFQRGQSSVEQMRPWKPFVLGVSVDEELADTKREIAKLRHEEESIRGEVSATSNRKREGERELTTAKAEATRLKQQLIRIDQDITELQEDARAAEQQQQQLMSQASVISDLQSAILAKQKECRESMKRLSDAKSRYEEEEEAILPVRQQLKEKKALQQEQEGSTCGLQRQLKTVLADLDRVNREKETNLKAVPVVEGKCEQLQQEIGKREKQAAEFANRASQLSERVHTRRSTAEVRAEREAIAQRLTEGRQRLGVDPRVLEKEYANESAHHATLTKELARMIEQTRDATAGLDKRMKRWQAIRKACETQSSLRFTNVMDERGHSGRLRCNHETGELHVEVELNARLDRNDPKRRKTTEFRSLSGGERSFCTIAMLLALWPSAESPFRALDEFDVFMDEEHRKTSFELLQAMCKLEPNHQFVFLTPVNVRHLVTGSDLRVHKMAERNQPTLDKHTRAQSSAE
eukprot:TRINITY_DN14852_c0_g1_i2.p1 TRINITY_DN14852_c0_g1~~TRINITY_DN14852_c0_g1_i2.p1  ORF type:complete len:960 (+),score=219.70 TRINITY_DN14852_c0_g1_i2:463-3342(+)